MGYGKNLENSWTDGFNNVKQKMNDFFQNLGENFANGLNNFQNWISNMLSAIVNWAKSFASNGKTAAVNLVRNIASEIKSLPGQFLQWGMDMMSNFASGIGKDSLDGSKERLVESQILSRKKPAFLCSR